MKLAHVLFAVATMTAPAAAFAQDSTIAPTTKNWFLGSKTK